VPDGKRYTLVWISTGSNEGGEYIHGAGACDMIIDANSRKGFKNLADHVNKMDAALKGRFRLEDLGATEKEILKQFIISFKQELWENSPEEFKQALS
jgi:alcohol dehydrogenase class IV